MDIKIAHSTLLKFLQTNATAPEIAKSLTLCGPSVDRLHQIKDDFQYEIEVITNRIDAISAAGLAREAVAILPRFGFKATLLNDPYLLSRPTVTGLTPLDLISDPQLVPQVSAIVVSNVEVKSSPEWLIHELEMAGERSINNLVDITNYLTRTLGHPIHFFDYDQIVDHKLFVRLGKSGETVKTLDGLVHTLSDEDIVIEDGSGQIIDLCGIMGGFGTQITTQTKRVLVFVPTYDPSHIRSTSLKLQKRTLAAQIYEKNPDPLLALPVLTRCLDMISELAGGKLVSKLVHQNHKTSQAPTIKLDLNWLKSFLGIEINTADVKQILTSLGFQMNPSRKHILLISVPSWRIHDITNPEDIAEEIARVYGYHQIKPVLPTTTQYPNDSEGNLKKELLTKTFLSHIGYTEVYNYSLVSQALFDQAQMPLQPSLELLNPLSSDYTHMRRSLIPSLISNFADNFGRTRTQKIFELSNIYLPDHNQPLPHEVPILATLNSTNDYLQAKGDLEALFDHLHITNLRFDPYHESDSVFETAQSVEIYDDQVFLGIFGRIKTSILKNFNLPDTNCYLANLDFIALSDLSTPHHPIKSVPTTNLIKEDLTIQSEQSIDSLLRTLRTSSPFVNEVTYLNSHQNKHTFSLSFCDQTKDLTKENVSLLKKQILAKLSA